MQHEDAVAPFLLPPSSTGTALELRYKTGRVVAWSSGNYQVEVDGQVVRVGVVIGGPWVHELLDRVGLLVAVDSYGTATYLVLGPVMTPDQARAAF